MNKQNSVAIIIVAIIASLLLNISILLFTAWVFSVTGSAWSFLILLFLFNTTIKRD